MRKAAKARLQIDQEKDDREIIITDLTRLRKTREKLISAGKTSFKRSVTQADSSAAAASQRAKSVRSSKLIQPKQFSKVEEDEPPQFTAA